MRKMTVFALTVRICAVALLTVLLTGLPAYAQDATPQPPYELHLKTDLAVLGAAGGAALLPVIFANKVEKSCPCSASSVNGFDRSTAGRRSDTIDDVSTGAVVALLAWPVASTFIDVGASKSAFTDGLIMSEAVLVNVALNQTVKLGVHRPRPLVYGLAANDPLLNKNDNYFSFYSEHTSVVFAAGVSYARTFALRHPESRYRWLVFAAAVGGGATVGSLRVLSGRHFPTDVITGAAAGTSMGLLVPQLHRRGTTAGVSIVPTRAGAFVSVQRWY